MLRFTTILLTVLRHHLTVTTAHKNVRLSDILTTGIVTLALQNFLSFAKELLPECCLLLSIAKRSSGSDVGHTGAAEFAQAVEDTLVAALVSEHVVPIYSSAHKKVSPADETQ